MGRRQVIDIPGVSHNAPIPVGIRLDNFVFSSAMMGMDPATGTTPDDPGRQAELVFTNLRTFLTAAGVTIDDVAHMTVFLTDNALRPLLNEQWLAWYPDENDRPARHVIVHPLPGNARIQIEAIAVAAS